MPRVSFLVPLYQAAHHWPEVLATMLAQSEENFEIVAVDDGSTDETRKLLEASAREEPRVRPVSVRHSGIVGALNAGLRRCRAPYVARLDADDRAHPERIARQRAFLEERPHLAAVGSAVRLRDQAMHDGNRGMQAYLDWTNRCLEPHTIRAQRFVESPIVHTSAMIRTDTLRALGGYREHPSPEDYDLWLRLLAKGPVVGKLADVLVEIGDDPQRLTRTDPRCSRESFDACRMHHLLAGPLRDHPNPLLWGAGKTGKRWLRDLEAAGRPVSHVADGNRRRWGATIRGARVVEPARLAELRAAMASPPPVLVAVAAHGAHETIMGRAREFGWTEGEDFLFLAGTSWERT